MRDPGELDRKGSARYDRVKSFQAYCRYLDGDESVLNELLIYAKRFFIMMVNKLYKRRSIEVREEFLQTSLVAMWWSVTNKRISRGLVRYHGYMVAIAKASPSRVRRTFWGRDGQKIGREEYMRKYFARMPDSRNTEAEMFIQELPGALRKRALKYSRFTQPNVRRALWYVLHRLTKQEPVNRTWMQINYGLSKEMVPFYVEHAIVLLRMVMYDMRKREVHFRSDNEKRLVLDGGLEPYAVAR